MQVAGVSFPWLVLLKCVNQPGGKACVQALQQDVIRMYLEYSLILRGEVKKEVINEMIRAAWLLQEEGANLNTSLCFEDKGINKLDKRNLSKTNLI